MFPVKVAKPLKTLFFLTVMWGDSIHGIVVKSKITHAKASTF